MDYYYPNSSYWSKVCKKIDNDRISFIYDDSVLIFGYYPYVHSLSFDNLKEQINDCFKKDFEKYIIYQFESLLDKDKSYFQNIIQYVEKADETWVSDLLTCRLLRKNVLNSFKINYKPYFPTPFLNCIKNKKNPEIDILYYGTLSNHKLSILNQIYLENKHQHHYKIVNVQNVEDKMLDNFIRNSKIILHLNDSKSHPTQDQIYISYALANNKCVLSEKSLLNYYPGEIVEFKSPSDCLDKIDYLLANDNWKKYPYNKLDIDKDYRLTHRYK